MGTHDHRVIKMCKHGVNFRLGGLLAPGRSKTTNTNLVYTVKLTFPERDIVESCTSHLMLQCLSCLCCLSSSLFLLTKSIRYQKHPGIRRSWKLLC